MELLTGDKTFCESLSDAKSQKVGVSQKIIEKQNASQFIFLHPSKKKTSLR